MKPTKSNPIEVINQLKYSTIDMPLGVFIDAIVDGDLSQISDWDDIYMQYCEAIGGKELKTKLREVTEMSVMKNKIQIAESCVAMLSMTESEEVFKILCELYPQSGVTKFSPDAIERIIAHLKRDVVELGITANEQKVSQNENKDYTRDYFTDMLIEISTAFKVNVGQNITLREYCRWVVKYKQYVETINKRQ
jgi:hypothetical protein